VRGGVGGGAGAAAGAGHCLRAGGRRTGLIGLPVRDYATNQAEAMRVVSYIVRRGGSTRSRTGRRWRPAGGRWRCSAAAWTGSTPRRTAPWPPRSGRGARPSASCRRDQLTPGGSGRGMATITQTAGSPAELTARRVCDSFSATGRPLSVHSGAWSRLAGDVPLVICASFGSWSRDGVPHQRGSRSWSKTTHRS